MLKYAELRLNKISIFTICLIGFLLLPTREEKVYGMNNVKSFTQQPKFCGESIAYGTYSYPQGSMDIFKTFFQNRNARATCASAKSYVKIFGGNQNYNALLKSSAKAVAANVMSSVRQVRGLTGIIIDWNYIQQGQVSNIIQWLSQFVAGITTFEVYLKAPASYFCYTQLNKKLILDVNVVQNFIIEVYGQSPLSYENGYDIFERAESKEPSNNKYPQKGCPQYPSLAQLAAYKGNFFLQTTSQIEQTCYLGPLFEQELQNYSKIYKNKVFYDVHPDSLIVL